MKQGQIITLQKNQYIVKSDDVKISCVIRGKIHKQQLLPRVGDFVLFDENKQVIEKVLPRKNSFLRPLVSNIDQAIIVTSVKEPDFSLSLLDRLLTLMELHKVEGVICLTKLDLITREEKESIFKTMGYYKELGYKVVTNNELDKIKEILENKTSVFIGQTGAGKSTLLNIIANCLQLKGKEYATSNSFGSVDYCGSFSRECFYTLGEDDYGNTINKLPENSRYIKSEDILYEIKKIQQKQILSDGMEYDYVKRGMSLLEAKKFLASKEGCKQEEYIKFAQEKYSNGETSMQYFEEYLQPDALYLLDEPEVSLSPANQVMLAEEINKMARLLECQFIIATHSPFMLGTLNAKIYNLDTKEYDVTKWSDLDNVRYFYNFFKKHEDEFKEDYP